MKDSRKAHALLDAARAELAAKRKIRETRFAETVLGWQSEEEARAADDSPRTVIGWDHPQAGPDSKTVALLAALAAEEQATNEYERQKARRFVYIVLGIILSGMAGFFLAGLF
jgi:hypothetical protein